MTDTAPSANGTTTVTPNGWEITWLEWTWRSTEVTTQQMCAVSETLGIWDWSVARPDSGPRQLATWIAVLWSAEDDTPALAEALALVLSQPMGAILQALRT